MAEDVRTPLLDLMASRPGPWFVYDLYKALGCKWPELMAALVALEDSGKVMSSRIPTGNVDHPVRRGWELAR